jgi:hypothetical protein
MMMTVAQELEILWADFATHDVDAKLAAFDRLQLMASQDDLSTLVQALQSSRSDVWVRELLAGPICKVGGTRYLPQLLAALDQNFAENYDNDGFQQHLIELASAEPEACKAKLLTLLDNKTFSARESAEWLLSFC